MGATAAGVQLAAGELGAAALPGGRSPLSGLGRSMIDLVPGPAVDMTVATAEAMDKPMLAGSLALEWVGVGALVGRFARPGRHAALALLVQGTLAGAAAASRPQSSTASSLAAGLLGGVAGAGALRWLSRDPSPARMASVAAAAAGIGGVARVLRRRQYKVLSAARDAVSLPAPGRPAPPPPPGAQFDVSGLSPLFTPPRDFYVTDVTFPVPRVDPRTWRLRVHGLVARELELGLDDLLGMELVELDATLACVHNPVGGPRIGTARWLGVPVAELLEQAGPQPAAEQLLAHSVDGFTAGIPVEHVTDGRHALVALGLGGSRFRSSTVSPPACWYQASGEPTQTPSGSVSSS